MCVACWGVSYVVNIHCCWAWQIGLYALEDCGVSSTDHVKRFGSDPVLGPIFVQIKHTGYLPFSFGNIPTYDCHCTTYSHTIMMYQITYVGFYDVFLFGSCGLWQFD